MNIETVAIVIGGLMMIIPALYGARYERAVWKLIESNPNKVLQILRSDTACVVDHAVPWLEKAQYTGPFHLDQPGEKTHSLFIKSNGVTQVYASLIAGLTTA
jgi:hypothetical protein